MKKVMYALLLPLVVISGLVFANIKTSDDRSTKTPPTQLTRADWEATPEGLRFNNWVASPEGKKVLAGAAKVGKQVRAFTSMEAVVTSLSLPPGSRLGFGVMARIEGEEYILSFAGTEFDTFQALHSLQVGDKIKIRSHVVSYAPKYAYPIIAGDLVERNGIVIYKRPAQKDGC